MGPELVGPCQGEAGSSEHPGSCPPPLSAKCQGKTYGSQSPLPLVSLSFLVWDLMCPDLVPPVPAQGLGCLGHSLVLAGQWVLTAMALCPPLAPAASALLQLPLPTSHIFM